MRGESIVEKKKIKMEKPELFFDKTRKLMFDTDGGKFLIMRRHNAQTQPVLALKMC